MGTTGEETAVRKALDDLVKAMLAADKAALAAKTADRLNFCHANGHIQNKTEFLTSKAIFKSITVEQPAVTVRGDSAVVRYTTVTEVEGGGRAFSLNLAVLHVWVKEDGAWKLLEHQGTSIKSPG